jgi:cell division protein FtsB
MNNILRKYLSLVVSAVVSLLLIASFGFFLGRYAVRYHRVTRELAEEQKRLDQLNRRKPFPNEENIRLLEVNREALGTTFRRLMGELSHGQYEPPPIEPARFPQELRRMNEGLRAMAQTGNVLLPPGFAYGFDRYFKGELPRRDEVPRLLTQLKAVEIVCAVLFEAGIVEILKVERQAFEQGSSPTAAGETAGARSYAALVESGGPPSETRGGGLSAEAGRDPGGLFTWERVAVEFVTREAGLWTALNGLMRQRAFTVISQITVTNETPRPPLKIPGSEEAPPGPGSRPLLAQAGVPPGRHRRPVWENEAELAPSEPGMPVIPRRPPTREERIVAGRDEVLRVRIEAEVYRFEKTAASVP